MILRLAVIASFFLLPVRTIAQDPAFNTAEGLAAELYTAVTFPPGQTPDWERVKSMFLPQAVIQLRTGRDSTSIFDVNGFVDDFTRFIRNFRADSTGFAERVVRMNPMVYGDMAHVLVLYEASIPGSAMPPQQGVDSFSLVRKNGRWWIVSITNEIPTKSRPVPEELREKH